jgi:hypothetical protein
VSGGARFAVAVVVAASIVGGGAAAERALGPRPLSEAPPVAGVSGAWFCPHGGGVDGTGWVMVANPTQEPADVRLTTFVQDEARSREATVAPGTQDVFEVSAETASSATVVEYFGPQVVAGSVTTGGRGGTAAEPCSDQTGTRWFAPEGTSTRGHTTRVVILNPFATDAVVGVTLHVGEQVVRPGRLSGIVLPARSVASYDLNRFALGEAALIAEVEATLGKVAVGGLVVGAGHVRSSLAVQEPFPRAVLPGGGSGVLTVLAPEPRDVAVEARAQGPEEQIPLLDEESIGGTLAAAFPVEVADGVVIEAEAGRSFVAGRRLLAPAPEEPREPPRRGGRRRQRRQERAPRPAPAADLASTGGSPAASPLWVVPPAVAPGGGPATSILLLQNPGPEAATVELVALSPDGATELDPIEVGPGTSTSVSLEGSEPVTVVARARVGALVASQAGASPSGFAVALGVPIPTPSRPGEPGISLPAG